MILKEYWYENFHQSGYGITKLACHAIDMDWPPIKGWLRGKGHIAMTTELIEIFERHIPETSDFFKNHTKTRNECT